VDILGERAVFFRGGSIPNISSSALQMAEVATEQMYQLIARGA